MSTVSYILIVVVCLIFSAYFSATETAFLSMNKTKIKTLAEKGNARAKIVCELDERYDKLISSILIGNNIVNILMASLATVLFTRELGDIGATVSTVVSTVAVLIFGEISPKSIAKDCAEQFVLFSAPIIRCIIWILTPLTFVFSLWKKLLNKIFRLQPSGKMSQEELLMMVDEVQQEGSIDENEGGLLKNAIEFSEQEARDVLIHRVDLAALPVEADKERIAQMFNETKYSRLLIYRDNIDNILGTLHQKDFYVGTGVTDKPIREILSPAIFVLENEPISLILKKLQRGKTHVAVVIDEYGGTCGIVTMEDILEELVGEIWDEHDEEEVLVRKLSANAYIADAAMNYADFAEQFNLKSDSEMVSVSGWVMEHFGRVPQVGDAFDCEGKHIQVTKVDNHRVDEIKVTVLQIEPTPDEK